MSTTRLKSRTIAVLVASLAWVAAAQAQTDSVAEAARLVQQHRSAEAEAVLDPILSQEPQNVRAILLLGRVRLEQGRTEESMQLFDQAMKLDPQLLEARVWKGNALAASHRWPEALTMYESVLQADPENAMAKEGEASTASQAALEARKSREMEASLGLLLRARTFVPHDPILLRNFGVQAMDMKLYADSEAALLEAHALRPDDALTLYALSRTQLLQQKMPQAEANMRAYLVLRPDDASAHYGLGRILHMELRLDEARSELNRSIQLKPDQTESYYELGQIELDVHNDGAATPLFEKVIARDPTHGGALAGMGIIAYRKKDYLTAEGFLKRAAASAPNYREARYYYGLTLMRLGKKELAAPELDAAIRLAHQENSSERSGMHLAGPPPTP
jgi:tetratricopeptide (TPR) repeat protein